MQVSPDVLLFAFAARTDKTSMLLECAAQVLSEWKVAAARIPASGPGKLWSPASSTLLRYSCLPMQTCI